MVYGRYNELVNGVYKPTNLSLGGHHIVGYTYRGIPCGVKHGNTNTLVNRMGTCQPSMEDFRLPSLEETPLSNKGAGFGNLLLLPTY